MGFSASYPTESQRQRIKPRLSSWRGPFVQRNPRSDGAREGIAMRKIAKSFFASKGAWAKAIAKKRRPTAALGGVWVEPVHETAIEMRERCRHHALIGLRHAAGFAGGHRLSKSILTIWRTLESLLRRAPRLEFSIRAVTVSPLAKPQNSAASASPAALFSFCSRCRAAQEKWRGAFANFENCPKQSALST